MLSLITSVHGSTGGDDVRLTGVPRLIRPRLMLVEDPVNGPAADSEPRGGLVDPQPPGKSHIKPESTEGGRRVSVLKWKKGAPLNLG